MKEWYDYLDEPIYRRLCECRTIKADLPALVNAKFRSFKDLGKQGELGYTKEDALIEVLKLLDCNGFDADISVAEYNSLKEDV